MSNETDVVILGAGPVGLTLANELARRGVKFRIFDKAPAIREVSKAMILHVRTQEVLDKVGVAEAARAIAQPLTEVVVHAYGKHIGAWDLDDIDSPARHPVILGQNRTEHLLLDLLESRGGMVEWLSEGTSFTQDDDGVETVVTVTNPETKAARQETVRSRYIVGAEGSNSLVRKTLGLSFEGERYEGEQFIQADCRIDWALPKGRSYLFLTDTGYMMVIEFPDDVVRIFISLPDAPKTDTSGELGAVEATNQVPTLDEIRDNLVRLSGFEATLTDAIWLARYRTSHRYTDYFSRGRAFVAGDAAHVHVPIGGQGMNTGIQDAFNLGWKLAGVVAGRLRPGILDTYHAERHPVAKALIKGTDFAYRGILHPSELKQRAARLFGPFLIGNSRVQTFMRDTLEELKIAYPDSLLNLDLGGAKGPKPGERVLDATLVRASDHATVTITALTRGTAWTLLLFAADAKDLTPLEALAGQVSARFGVAIMPMLVSSDLAATSTACAQDHVLIDALRLAHMRYGVSDPTFYLLRPDTFVGARGPIAKGTALLDHLASIFA